MTKSMVGVRKCNEPRPWHGYNCADLYLLSSCLSDVLRKIAPSKLCVYRIAFQDNGYGTVSEAFVRACDMENIVRLQQDPDTS